MNRTRNVLARLLDAVDTYTLAQAGSAPTDGWINGLKEALLKAYPNTEIHYTGYSDRWAAVYVNGQIDTDIDVGDANYRVERVLEMFGVTEVQDNAFMQGQNQRGGVARTLDEVTAYRTRRETLQQTAEDNRKKAEALLAAAAKLDEEAAGDGSVSAGQLFVRDLVRARGMENRSAIRDACIAAGLLDKSDPGEVLNDWIAAEVNAGHFRQDGQYSPYEWVTA